MLFSTAGLPQYGQLGHGTDNEVSCYSLFLHRLTILWIYYLFTMIWFMLFQYNAKDSSVKLTYDPQPRPRVIATFSGKTVVKVACGTNHTGFPLLSFFRVIMINTDTNPISLLLCCSCSWFQWLCLHVCVLFTTYLHIFKTEVVKRHEFLCICCMQSTYVQDITFFFQFWGFLFFPLLCFFLCVWQMGFWWIWKVWYYGHASYFSNVIVQDQGGSYNILLFYLGWATGNRRMNGNLVL